MAVDVNRLHITATSPEMNNSRRQFKENIFGKTYEKFRSCPNEPPIFMSDVDSSENVEIENILSS